MKLRYDHLAAPKSPPIFPFKQYPTMLSFSEAAVISTMLQGILYGTPHFTCKGRKNSTNCRLIGFSLAMFILAGSILLRGRTRRINWVMLSAGFGLLVLSTAVTYSKCEPCPVQIY